MPFHHLKNILASCIPHHDVGICLPSSVCDLERELLLHICHYLNDKLKGKFRIANKQIYMSTSGCPLDLGHIYLPLNEHTQHFIGNNSWRITDVGVRLEGGSTALSLESFFNEMTTQNVRIRRIQISNDSTVNNALKIIESAVNLHTLCDLEEISLVGFQNAVSFHHCTSTTTTQKENMAPSNKNRSQTWPTYSSMELSRPQNVCNSLIKPPSLKGNLNSMKHLTNMKKLKLSDDSNDKFHFGNSNFSSPLPNASMPTMIQSQRISIFGDYSDIKHMSTLQHLDLRNTNVRGSISNISHLKDLKELFLWNAFGNIEAVTPLKKLKKLSLGFCQDVYGSLTVLRVLSQCLEHLDLSNTLVRGDIEHLTPLKALKWLSLSQGSKNILGCINSLNMMDNLEHVDLSYTSVYGNIENLCSKNLKFLNLMRSCVDVELFACLSRLNKVPINFQLVGTENFQ